MNSITKKIAALTLAATLFTTPLAQADWKGHEIAFTVGMTGMLVGVGSLAIARILESNTQYDDPESPTEESTIVPNLLSAGIVIGFLGFVTALLSTIPRDQEKYQEYLKQEREYLENLPLNEKIRLTLKD